jgi:hypothetical protein
MYEKVLPGRGNAVYSQPLLDDLEKTQVIINKCNDHHRSRQPVRDTPTHYTTKNLRGDCITRPMPTLKDGEVLDLVLHNYNAIAQGLEKKEDAESAETDLYLVKAVNRKTKHEDKKQCRNPINQEETPYSYWCERYHGCYTGTKTWLKKEPNDDIKGYVYRFVENIELTSQQQNNDKRQLKQWHATRDRLKHKIEKYGDKLKQVNQVICFGLGSLSYNQPRSFMQHLAALTVRNEIQRLRNDSSEIEILAQDPAYCSNCKDILQKELGIKAVTTFEGHRLLNKTTLTISIAPGAPVCQMIADLTHEDGGPAAMMCDAFDDNYLKEEMYPERKFASDESTKNMVDYRKGCDTEDLDDAKDILGMTCDEFEKEFPRKPAEQLDEFIKEGEDIRDLSDWYGNDRVWLEKRMINALQAKNELSGVEQQSKEELRAGLDKNFTKLSDDEKKYFGDCNRLYQLHGQVYFPNLTLYVRRN